MQPVMPPELDDEALLDLLFDRIVDLLEDGASPCAAELAGDRPHLLHRVEELIRLAQQVKPEAGQPLPQIPGYTVLRELGRGGMGAVYLARQERLGGRPVALKLLPAGVALSSKARQRFRDEAHAIARLSHPNIVAVHDVVSADGLHAYAMEWVDGQSLADWISERCGGHTDVVFVCRVGVAVARALHAVHAAGLLHRDVKPSNILLRRDGTPLLSDFGLVREADATLTHAGHFAGTMAYSSPEQLRGQPENLDSRSDVYALGVTLYHALALRLPFAAQRPEVVVQQIEGGAAPPLRTFAPRVPVDLQTIVAKAMDQDPARRYDTAAELADDLERLLSLQPIKARPAGLMTRAIKLARRKRGALAAGAAGATLTGAVLVALGVYVFLVPRWVEWHLTKARLALLHPDQASTLHWSHFAETPTWALSATFLNQSAIDGALAHYDAALRWSPFDDDIRAERAIVRSASAPGQASPIADSPQDSIVRASHVRLAGLRAFLLWDTDAAIESWSRYESLQDQVREPDPFVAAALGLLYLVEEHPARAYPRLRDAVQGFPEVGFLTVYLADAAVQCNDLSEARRLLDRARALPGLDGHRGLERVEADLLAAEGRPEEAEALYRKAIELHNPIAQLHLARLFERSGRISEALLEYRIACTAHQNSPKAMRALVAAADRWWSSLTPAQRLGRIRAALDETPWGPDSFTGLLLDYVGACRSAAMPAGVPATPRSRIASLKSEILTALWQSFSSPSLERLSLSELAERMEVQDMSLWSRITSFPRILKELHFAAWRWPWLTSAAGVIERGYQVLTVLGRRFTFRGLSTGLALAAALGAASPGEAQVTTFFDGTFDPADWTVTVVTSGNGGTHSFVQDTTGNPAPSLRVTNTVAPGSVNSLIGGVYLRNGATYDPSVSGAIQSIDLSSDYIMHVGFGDGQAEQFALRQGGIVYLGGYHLTNAGTWTHWSVNGLTASSFWNADFLVHPDFSVNGSLIEFGFWRANSGAGYTIIGGIDNWSVTIHHTPPPCTVAPCFQGLGDLPGGVFESSATAISADGTTVVGYSKSAASGGEVEAFRWHAQTGMMPLGDLPGNNFKSAAFDVSSDGTVIVGYSHSGPANYPVNPREGFVWTPANGMLPLGDIPGGAYFSQAFAVSDDGRIIGGQTVLGPEPPNGGGAPPCRWVDGVGPLPLSGTGNESYGAVNGASADGSVLVGHRAFGFSESFRAFRWTAGGGLQEIGDLPGGIEFGLLTRPNADGSVCVGYGHSAAGQEAMRWADGTGLVGLGDFSGGAFASSASSVSADGELIVGYGSTAAGQEAALWVSGSAVTRIVDVLAANGVDVPVGWSLQYAADISVNCGVVSICGTGTNPQGNTEAWIARYLIDAPVPVAAAGDDQSVAEGMSVVLDGSASTSGCGPLTYEWTQLAGDAVTLDLSDPARPTFTAPQVPMGGAVLTFQLVVSDGTSTSEPDVVNVTVTNINHAPVVVADDLCGMTPDGEDLAVAEGGIATLDASNSYDEDDEPLTYTWMQTAGTPVALDLTDPAKPTFTAPLVGVLGETLTFELTVSDGLDSSGDTVDVCVENVNHAPIAHAGDPQTVAEGSAVVLDASASNDPDGDTLTYEWTQFSGPAVTLSDPASATPSFTAPQVGAGGATLVFRVTVDDGYFGSDDAEVTITVQDANSEPFCDLARPSVDKLWPPNHKLVAVSILGVTDPENNDITITILDVTQDEPINGLGDGDTAPDAVIQGSTVLLRAERAGGGNGRVYHVTFLADDGFGGMCIGTVTVTVPHDKGRNAPPAIDDGQIYGSTGP